MSPQLSPQSPPLSEQAGSKADCGWNALMRNGDKSHRLVTSIISSLASLITISCKCGSVSGLARLLLE